MRKTPGRRRSRNLELQHVAGVVMDLDAQPVDIGGVGPTAAILFVANDVGCHSAGGFVGCCDSVAVVLRIEAPGYLLHVAGLKQKPANQNWTALHPKH